MMRRRLSLIASIVSAALWALAVAPAAAAGPEGTLLHDWELVARGR